MAYTCKTWNEFRDLIKNNSSSYSPKSLDDYTDEETFINTSYYKKFLEDVRGVPFKDGAKVFYATGTRSDYLQEGTINSKGPYFQYQYHISGCSGSNYENYVTYTSTKYNYFLINMKRGSKQAGPNCVII